MAKNWKTCSRSKRSLKQESSSPSSIGAIRLSKWSKRTAMWITGHKKGNVVIMVEENHTTQEVEK